LCEAEGDASDDVEHGSSEAAGVVEVMSNTPEYYSFEELREMGCPDGLLIQYVMLTKAEIDKIVGRRK
jgi:hypothetical protein